MDKEWMYLPSRLVPEYEEGVKKFIAQARNYAKTREVILCPCKRCKNKKYRKFDEVYDHLIIKGFDPSYTIWVFHGETYNSQSQGEGSSKGVQKEDEIREAYHLYKDVFVPEEVVEHTISEAKDYEFDDLLKDAETPLFPGCTTYTKLSAVVTLYNYKSTNGQTDNSFNELLKILGDMLPENNTLPETVYIMRKLLKPFDLGYEKIHACPNDCCLFRKELKDLDSCPKCGSSRWKKDKVTTKVCKGVPQKVLRYFPVIPRLKRMFKSKEKAEELIWHSKHKSQDHMMRHPVDSVAWDTIDHKWPDFASDPRNLRLGLATDGFNPFGDLSSRYSCWPVILVNYNLSPLMCMTKENLMLTLLIPGPRQPGNDIDVYLEPLVDDLKELWYTGVEVYDALSKSMFNLKAILMWTINDFPAYGNLAGCATKGKLGCPICGEDICSMWLKYSRKFAYLGHRRFLAPDHPFRQKKKWFNGKKESKGKPRPLNGLEIFNALKDIENDWGKKQKGETVNTLRKKRKKQDSSVEVQKTVQRWKKKSIFFDLPYWSKEIQECPSESQNTTNIADDAISLVFGKEARGRVRGMGFGVTPSKVGAYVKQNGTTQQFQTMIQSLQQQIEEMRQQNQLEMQEMRAMFVQSMKQQNQQEQVASGGIGSGIGNEFGSNGDVDIGAKKIGSFDHISQSRNVSRGDIRVNTKCKLLHWCGDELVVAEGRIASTDPNTKVHHVVLGRSYWKVWIDKVLVEKVDLIRPNDEMQFLEDAIGSTVAWLSKFILLCD